MTTIVTRLYEDPAHADAVVASLKAEGFPESCMDVVEQKSRTSAQDQIQAAGVPADTAQQYAQHLSANRALLVVRAPFVPFGAAAHAIAEADKYPAFNAGVANQNANVPDEPDRDMFISILASHRLFLTNALDVRNNLKPRGLSNAFRIPTLASKPEKRMRPAIMDARFANFLFPLLSRGGLMTRKPLMNGFFGNFIAPHLTRQKAPRSMSHFRLTN